MTEKAHHRLSLASEQPKQSKGRMFRDSIRDCQKIKFYVSVTTISSYSFEVKGLKFDMKIYLIYAVKLVGQIFEFLFGAEVIEFK